MKIVGIRNKSASVDHAYFFSVESDDLNELKGARDKVRKILRCEYVDRWHD